MAPVIGLMLLLGLVPQTHRGQRESNGYEPAGALEILMVWKRRVSLGLKPRVDFAAFSARLKSCPFKTVGVCGTTRVVPWYKELAIGTTKVVPFKTAMFFQGLAERFS